MAGASATKAPRFGLAAKIFLASALVVIAVLLATFGVTSMQANRTADASIERALTNTRQAVEDFLAARTDALASMSAVSAEVPQFRDRLFSGEPADVRDQAEEYRDLLRAAWVLVTDHGGVLLHRTDYPDEAGDTLGGALIGQALEGEQPSGAFIDDRDPAATRLFLAVATPLRDRADVAPRGVLVSAYALDDSLAQAISQATNADVVFFALDTAGSPVVVAGTLPKETIAPALRETGFVAALAADSAGSAMTADMDGDHLIGRAGAIRSAGGAALGGFLALRSRAAELGAFRALQRTMILAIAFGVVLALVSAFLLARQIAGPVRQLVLATRRVQDGDYSVNIDVKSRDEIGLLSRAFQGLVEDLKEKADLVEYMVAASAAAATQPIDALPSGRRTVAAEMEAGGRALKPGTVFAGRYEVKEILGMGGMGVVYRAFDRELGEPVAIKTLRPEILADDGVALERFKQEIRLARKIAHRNVVRTYDLGEANGMYYLTMEFVEGTSLKQLIQGRGRLPVPVTLTIGKQLCRALEVAHEQGVIHRDIKPQNMVVDPSGFLKVMDFGIARLARRQGQGLTEKGTSVGTPDYMSPEQLVGDELDARSDLYAAGVVLFECVTGRVPFVADTTWALISKHIEEAAPDPRSVTPEVPLALSGAILRAMAKKPDERFRSAAEMHDALAAIG